MWYTADNTDKQTICVDGTRIAETAQRAVWLSLLSEKISFQPLPERVHW